MVIRWPGQRVSLNHAINMKRVGFFATFLFLLSLIGVNPLIGQRTDKVVARLAGDQIRIRLRGDDVSLLTPKDYRWTRANLSWYVIIPGIAAPKDGGPPIYINLGKLMISEMTIEFAPILSVTKRAKRTVLVRVRIKQSDGEAIRRGKLCNFWGRIPKLGFFLLE